jgi:hypothetical protein
VLKEESTLVVLVKFPGTLAAGLKHDAFVALSDKRAAQSPALARTIRRRLAVRVSSPPRCSRGKLQDTDHADVHVRSGNDSGRSPQMACQALDGLDRAWRESDRNRSTKGLWPRGADCRTWRHALVGRVSVEVGGLSIAHR